MLLILMNQAISHARARTDSSACSRAQSFCRFLYVSSYCSYCYNVRIATLFVLLQCPAYHVHDVLELLWVTYHCTSRLGSHGAQMASVHVTCTARPLPMPLPVHL